MLQELYQYAQTKGLAAKPGFKEKNVKWYISFSADGRFIGIDPAIGKAYCPDIGSLANGTTKSNIIAEKAEVIFNLPDKDGNLKRAAKQTFYMDSMREAAKSDPLFLAAINGLSEQFEAVKEAYLTDSKRLGADIISIKVDGKPLENSSDYLEWWENFRKSFSAAKSDDKAKVRCFITGEFTEPMATVPPFQGLSIVGGHTKGDALICFDKDAYRSYGFEQAANAAVSEEAMTAVNSALNELLKKENSSILAGAKNTHWYKETPQIDVLDALNFDLGIDLGIDAEDSESQDEEDKQADERKIKKLYKYIFNGKSLEKPDNRYYMMSLSGVNGRVMVRSFDEGSYDDLYNNVTQWYKDLSLINYSGTGEAKFPKLFTINTRLLKYSTDKTKLSDRIKDELSGLEPQIMYAITHNTPLPDTAAAKALAYIRSDMYGSSQDDGSVKNKQIDRISCQILKTWLNRKYRNQNKEDYVIMTEINKDSPSKAYQTGRLMAVYAKIQNVALGDVNAGVVEKYYTSACTAPALVIGKLATMSQYHLSKLDKGLAIYFSKQLEEIAEKIGCSIPANFSLTEQAEFALGYYHQNAAMHLKKNDNTTDNNKED